MKVSEQEGYSSKTVKAADLQGKEVRLTIDNATLEKVGNEMKIVLYFVGKEKGVVLNKGNSNVLCDAFGDDTENWRQQGIILFAIWTEYAGKPVQGLRIRIPTARDTASARPAKPDTISSGPPAKPKFDNEDLNDDVPF